MAENRMNVPRIVSWWLASYEVYVLCGFFCLFVVRSFVFILLSFNFFLLLCVRLCVVFSQLLQKRVLLACWWSNSKISVRLYGSDESIQNVVSRLRSTYIQKNILPFPLHRTMRQTNSIHWCWAFAFRCQWLWIFISHGPMQSAILIHMFGSQTHTHTSSERWSKNSISVK